jgi:hypothetical protein
MCYSLTYSTQMAGKETAQERFRGATASRLKSRAMAMKPLVSVVLEGYNEEINGLAPLDETIDALLRQDFPLNTAELILFGNPRQIEHWKPLTPSMDSFQKVRMIPVDPQTGHYWQIKNMGAELAEGEIVAHIDSDAVPGPRWLSSLVKAIQNGADVSVGPSLWRTARLGPDSPWLLAAALPTFSLMLARSANAKAPRAGCIMAHNVAFRRDVCLRFRFHTGRRSYSSVLIYFELVRAGMKISFEPDQKVAHGMTFRWWLARKHVRTGWETRTGRSADKDWPRLSALERVPLLEPVVLRMALVCRDARHWFRFAPVVGVSRPRALLLFPLAMLASLAARTAEMVGMYAALLAPKSTEHRARF